MHDALEQLKTLFKVFQLFVIDLDSRMQALHLYFICQTDLEASGFYISFLKGMKIGMRARGVFFLANL